MEDKVSFLWDSLQLIAQTQGNAGQVYAFWWMNIDKIDASLIQIMSTNVPQILAVQGKEMRESMTQTLERFGYLMLMFPDGNREINIELAITSYQICDSIFTINEYPSEWARCQNNLGAAYNDRILGERKENIELAIAACRAALEVRTRQAFPVDWARSQNNLGAAYIERIVGERKENVELAIAAYRAALEVYTRQAFPVDWARSQTNLGNAYNNRIAGERQENFELAIAAYRAALEVRTRQAFPVEWAMCQTNLGNAYNNRIAGECQENFELAIAAYRAALEVYTRQAFPVEWGDTQNNLGNAYRNRIAGERQENMELAIATYRASLEVYTRQAFPVEWADTQHKLGNTYRNRIAGERQENIELAIAAYRAALEVRTRQAFPLKWGDTQTNLGAAYNDRIAGEREENMELAIAAYRAALEVRTRQAFPVEWAGIQNNLGAAYHKRIAGDRKENIELAIAVYHASLEVYTRQAFPVEWARSQASLGGAYCERIAGEREENIELAIAACRAALEVRTRQAFPVDWAGSQNNLGNAYNNRIAGERKENIELAIAACRASLEVYTRQAFPVEWALVQNNLGVAYSNRIAGERLENIELAIAACRAALEVRTRQAFPVDWAGLQNNLGLAYRGRIAGEHQENIKLAIAACHASLEVYTRQAFPVEWAQSQNNLGLAYNDRIAGEHQENMELAIAACHASLEVYTRQAFPFEWARSQANLGIVYSNRILGEHKENIELAIQAFRAALEVNQPELLPLDCLLTGRGLGNLGFKEGDWQIAIEGFEKAITAVETSRSWAMSEIRRQEILDESFYIYEKMVQSCINANRLDLALQTVERIRSKRLVDLMSAPDLYPQGEIPEPVQLILARIANTQQQMDDLRMVAPANAPELVGTGARDRAAVAAPTAEIHALEVQKLALVDELSRYDAVSAQLVEIAPPDVSQIQTELLDRPDIALLSLYTTTQDTHVLVVRSDSIQCFTCPGQGIEQLQNWLYDEWVLPYINDRKSWQRNMPECLQQLAAKLDLDRLVSEHLHNVRELILIPHLFLHLIPFAALPLNGQHYFGDRFLLRYAPSCQVLKFCTDRHELLPQQRYGTVENTMEDLPFSAIEGEIIARIFQIEDSLRLRSEQATRTAYKQLLERVNSVASCHHAQSRLDNPLESALILANGTRVTLADLLSPAWRFANLSDVFLSCCETGMTTPKSLTDELLTLGTGFLCAGARSVISSLWAVSDIATALLSQIYHQDRSRGENRIVALQKAQQELRSLTGDRLKALSEAEFIPALTAQQEQQEQCRQTARRQKQQVPPGSEEYRQWQAEENRYSELIDRLESTIICLEDLSEKGLPFNHPVYWAPFTCQGLR